MKTILSICFAIFLGLGVRVALTWPDNNLHIIFCDVGQGDAILVQFGFWQMLVDTGPDDQVVSCLQQHVPFWDKQLEVIVLTHTHADHIGGFPAVLANYQVRDLFLTDVADTQEFKNLLVATKTNSNSHAMFRNGILGRRINFSSGGEVLFLAPSETPIKVLDSSLIEFSETMLSDVARAEYITNNDPNERSIVLLLRYYQFELLLMADATAHNELALLERGLINRVEGIKVGHHGAKTSTSEPFIQKTQPEFAVVSCGLNNKFGHPSLEALQILQKNYAQVWRVDELGEIHLTTNGQYYWLLE